MASVGFTKKFMKLWLMKLLSSILHFGVYYYSWERLKV